MGLWLMPHELEKEFNASKRLNPTLSSVTGVRKFVAQGALRNYLNARSCWLSREPRALEDAEISTLLSHVRYKAQWHRVRIVQADQW